MDKDLLDWYDKMIQVQIDLAKMSLDNAKMLRTRMLEEENAIQKEQDRFKKF